MTDPDRTGGPVPPATGTLGPDAPLSLAPAPSGEPAFDDHRPPSAALVGDCGHCGLRMPACPTSAVGGQEMDPPRGRVSLIMECLEGEPMTPAMVEHFDACLG